MRGGSGSQKGDDERKENAQEAFGHIPVPVHAGITIDCHDDEENDGEGCQERVCQLRQAALNLFRMEGGGIVMPETRKSFLSPGRELLLIVCS